MAYYFSLEGPAMEAYRKMLGELKAKAMKELKLEEDEIIVRMLRPEDIGLSNPEWTFNVASGDAWNTGMVNTAIADNRFVGIHGILIEESGAQAGLQLKVTRMGQVKRYWHIQGVNTLESPTIFFDDPIMAEQNTTLTIDIYATAADADFRLCFLGAVAEKKGLLVQ